MEYNVRRWGSDGWCAGLRRSGKPDGAKFGDWRFWPNSLKGHQLIALAQERGLGREAKELLLRLTVRRGGWGRRVPAADSPACTACCHPRAPALPLPLIDRSTRRAPTCRASTRSCQQRRGWAYLSRRCGRTWRRTQGGRMCSRTTRAASRSELRRWAACCSCLCAAVESMPPADLFSVCPSCRLGISGVPYFIISGPESGGQRSYALSGAQPTAALAKALQRVVAEQQQQA